MGLCCSEESRVIVEQALEVKRAIVIIGSSGRYEIFGLEVVEHCYFSRVIHVGKAVGDAILEGVFDCTQDAHPANEGMQHDASILALPLGVVKFV